MFHDLKSLLLAQSALIKLKSGSKIFFYCISLKVINTKKNSIPLSSHRTKTLLKPGPGFITAPDINIQHLTITKPQTSSKFNSRSNIPVGRRYSNKQG